MKRPPWMSRGLWFAQRRNRRGRPITLRTFDEMTARVLGGKPRIEDLANQPGLFAAFSKITHIEPFYVPPLFERREVKP